MPQDVIDSMVILWETGQYTDKDIAIKFGIPTRTAQYLRSKNGYKSPRKSSRKQTGENICINCKKCFGGCSWSRDFVPVKGWDAIEHIIPDLGVEKHTYHIISCPGFDSDLREN